VLTQHLHVSVPSGHDRGGVTRQVSSELEIGRLCEEVAVVRARRAVKEQQAVVTTHGDMHASRERFDEVQLPTTQLLATLLEGPDHDW
jgi:hypothetical protein